ncbi:MAG: KEOPS complex kinase/ATPase Bud32 [Candidatus Pacearchaeota archaeon]
MKIIAIGAEAVLYKKNNKLIKKRIKKDYRNRILDFNLRKYRTRREARILEKASYLIDVPKVHKVDEKKAIIVMDFIEGKKLSDWFEKLKKDEIKNVAEKIGKAIAKLHNANIIHGDLTTSNMILNNDKVFFIDFGLAFHSNRIEDKAVDIYLLLQALKSKHFSIYEEISKLILNSYFNFVEQNEKIKEQLKKVELRRRYKGKNL